MSEELQSWRAEIDTIDRELLRLLSARAEVALRIADCKRSAGIPIVDPERESQVLARVCRENPGPLPGVAVTRLFSGIIQESRRLEGEALSHWTTTAAGGAR